jgi:hypothetical protein
MGLAHHLARILTAAVVAVAFCLVPTLAVAHAGHQHPAAHAHAATVDAAPAAHHAAAVPDHQPTAALVGAAELRTATTGAQAGAPAPHCCSGSSCCFGMACCALALAPEQPAIAAPILSSSLLIFDPRGGPSFNPDGLRKPPKSFA